MDGSKDTYLPETPNIAIYPARHSSIYLALVILGRLFEVISYMYGQMDIYRTREGASI